MTDLHSPISEPEDMDELGLVVDAYIDASEGLMESVLHLAGTSDFVEVIQLRYLSLVATVEALLATAGKEVPQC